MFIKIGFVIFSFVIFPLMTGFIGLCFKYPRQFRMSFWAIAEGIGMVFGGFIAMWTPWRYNDYFQRPGGFGKLPIYALTKMAEIVLGKPIGEK